jgi:phage shock protein A
MSPIADELQRIAEEAQRLRRRLGELSQACAELRTQLSREPADETTNNTADTTRQDTPRKLQSVS